MRRSCNSSSVVFGATGTAVVHELLCGAPSSAVMHATKRHVVQSHQGGQTSLYQRYKEHNQRKVMRKNTAGGYYRMRFQQVFPSTESLEVALTEETYAPAARVLTPLLSPTQQQQQQRDRHLLLTAARGVKRAPTTFDDVGEVDHDVVPPSPASSTMELVVTPDDLLGTPLESVALGEARESGAQKQRSVAAEQYDDAHSHTSWKSFSPGLLDPVVAQLATDVFGPTATRTQVRLLRSLLNEDHNDVLMSSADGSGKTSGLLLALLQGMRSEDTGVNVLVASNSINVKRAVDFLVKLIAVFDRNATTTRSGTSTSLSIDDGDGLLADGQPMKSWLLMAPFRESVSEYARVLKHKGGRRRVRMMITTSDVFCELMFEHKVEFEALGYLRRVYVDDSMSQLQMLPDDAPTDLVQARLRDPVALELLLGTLHQLPGPHIRSVMQITCVSAGLDTNAVDHLKQLCIKRSAQEVIVSPAHLLPANIHCTFVFRPLVGRQRPATLTNPFMQSNELDDTSSPYSIYHYVAMVLWSAASTLCGRVVIFIPKEHDILAVRKVLRRLGMDAKLLSEVTTGQTEQSGAERPWKFVLMREHEGDGVQLRLVSHVVITFPPSSRASLLHMSGRTGQLGGRGWVLTITDQRHARHVRSVAEELQVDFINSVVRLHQGSGSATESNGVAIAGPVFQKVLPTDVDRWTRAPALYGLDPQYVVEQHYDGLTENADMAQHKREFFHSRNPNLDFYMEDYTPVPELHARHQIAQRIEKEFEQDPSVAQKLQQQGLLNDDFKPTSSMRRVINKEASIRSKQNNPRLRRKELPVDVTQSPVDQRDQLKEFIRGQRRGGARGGSQRFTQAQQHHHRGRR